MSNVVPAMPWRRRFWMKGITVVMPPNAALMEKVSILSVLTGWLWASIMPGSTYFPEASTTLFDGLSERPGPTSEIMPFLTERPAW